MTTKLYLRKQTTPYTAANLPSATKLSSSTITVTAGLASTNQLMSTTAGAAQSLANTLTTSATVSAQTNWFARFLSAPLEAQTLGSVSVHWLLQGAATTSNTNSLFKGCVTYLGVWRPSSNATVHTWTSTSQVLTNAMSGAATETLYAAAGGAQAETTSDTFTCLQGDMIVIEIGGTVTQAMATAYTWTNIYDGTTDDSASNCAAYLVSPTTLTFHPGDNLITNGSFEDTAQTWGLSASTIPWFNTVQGTAAGTTVQDATTSSDGTDSAKSVVTAVDGSFWHYQIGQSIPNALTAGTVYVVTLWAKTLVNQNIDVNVQQGASPFTSYSGDVVFAVTTTWQQYRFIYVQSPSVAAFSTSLFISTAYATGTVWIDQVTMYAQGQIPGNKVLQAVNRSAVI